MEVCGDMLYFIDNAYTSINYHDIKSFYLDGATIILYLDNRIVYLRYDTDTQASSDYKTLINVRNK